MSQAIFLSGWAQPKNYNTISMLEGLVPNSSIHQIDYHKFSNVNNLFLKAEAINPKIVIGWSLGGMLASRMIHKKVINPSHLFLISPLFCLSLSDDLQKNFVKFSEEFNKNPKKTIKRFFLLIQHKKHHFLDSHKHKQKLLYQKEIFNCNHLNLNYWLQNIFFSCNSIDFSLFPNTTIIYGINDSVVSLNQVLCYFNSIKQSKLKILKNCSHSITEILYNVQTYL